MEQVQVAAFNLKHRTGAAYLSAEFSELSNSDVPLEAFDTYLRDLLTDAGQPSDPIERIMIEQLAMAHHKIGRLNRQSIEAKTIELSKAYDATAISLLTELRRLALALKEYRTPVSPKTVTVVKQQNVAQNQQVALIDGQQVTNAADTFRSAPKEKVIDSKLRSNRSIEHAALSDVVPQPPPSRSRETQPIAPSGAQRQGAGTIASYGTRPPSLAFFNRATDGER